MFQNNFGSVKCAPGRHRGDARTPSLRREGVREVGSAEGGREGGRDSEGGRQIGSGGGEGGGKGGGEGGRKGHSACITAPILDP